MENKAFSISRKIGNTLYQANVYQTPKTTESIEDKILRLIRQEALDFFGGYVPTKEANAIRKQHRLTRKTRPKPHNANGDPLMQWVAVPISITIQHFRRNHP